MNATVWGDNNASTNAGVGPITTLTTRERSPSLTTLPDDRGTTYYYAFKGVNTSGGSGEEPVGLGCRFHHPDLGGAPILGNLHSATDATSSAAKLTSTSKHAETPPPSTLLG